MYDNDVLATELFIASSLAHVHEDPFNVPHVGIHDHPQPSTRSLDQCPVKRRKTRRISAWRVTSMHSSRNKAGGQGTRQGGEGGPGGQKALNRGVTRRS